METTTRLYDPTDPTTWDPDPRTLDWLPRPRATWEAPNWMEDVEPWDFDDLPDAWDAHYLNPPTR